MENEMPVFLVVQVPSEKPLNTNLNSPCIDWLDLFCFEWMFSSVSGFANGVILNFKHITNEVRKNKTSIDQMMYYNLNLWCVALLKSSKNKVWV